MQQQKVFAVFFKAKFVNPANPSGSVPPYDYSQVPDALKHPIVVLDYSHMRVFVLVRRETAGSRHCTFVGYDWNERTLVFIKMTGSCPSSLVNETTALDKLKAIPNIPKLYAVGRDLFGSSTVLVTSYIAGANLQSRFENFGTSSIAQLAYYGKQIAHTLCQIHASGWMHRDIKPSNIVVGLYGVTFIVDFEFAVEANSTTIPAGTIAFVSKSALQNKSPEVQDYFESLIYTLNFLKSGSLPDEHIELRNRIDVETGNFEKSLLITFTIIVQL